MKMLEMLTIGENIDSESCPVISASNLPVSSWSLVFRIFQSNSLSIVAFSEYLDPSW